MPIGFSFWLSEVPAAQKYKSPNRPHRGDRKKVKAARKARHRR